ncbi:MAG: IS3 family transposase [Flavobacteriales bacterium]
MTEVETEIAALKKEVYETVYQNQKEAEIAIFEYIEEFYNRNRRHSALGYLTMNEFEKLFATSTSN